MSGDTGQTIKKKEAEFLGDSEEVIARFPDHARKNVGFQIFLVETGDEPNDWKPMKTIGAGVNEIRVQDGDGWYRVFYVAKFEEAVYVLHAIEKKTRKTPQDALDIARKRYKELEQRRKKAIRLRD